MTIKGVIFDLDGLLIDSEEFHYSAWVKVLRPLGVNFSKKEYSDYAGKQIDAAADELITKNNLKISRKNLVAQRKNAVIGIFENNYINLMPYAKEALEFFNNGKKIKVGLASGSASKMVELKLKSAGIYEMFSVIVGGDDVENGKPAPDIYLLAVEMLKLNPIECLALEDTQSGVEAAKSAGLFCFAIPNEYTHAQNFSKADEVFESLKEATDYIKTNNLYVRPKKVFV